MVDAEVVVGVEVAVMEAVGAVEAVVAGKFFPT